MMRFQAHHPVLARAAMPWVLDLASRCAPLGLVEGRVIFFPIGHVLGSEVEVRKGDGAVLNANTMEGVLELLPSFVSCAREEG
jgi:hypothetical protein